MLCQLPIKAVPFDLLILAMPHSCDASDTFAQFHKVKQTIPSAKIAFIMASRVSSHRPALACDFARLIAGLPP